MYNLLRFRRFSSFIATCKGDVRTGVRVVGPLDSRFGARDVVGFVFVCQQLVACDFSVLYVYFLLLLLICVGPTLCGN